MCEVNALFKRNYYTLWTLFEGIIIPYCVLNRRDFECHVIVGHLFRLIVFLLIKLEQNTTVVVILPSRLPLLITLPLK